MLCTACGAQLNDGARFCPICGKAQENTGANQAAQMNGGIPVYAAPPPEQPPVQPPAQPVYAAPPPPVQPAYSAPPQQMNQAPYGSAPPPAPPPPPPPPPPAYGAPPPYQPQAPYGNAPYGSAPPPPPMKQGGNNLMKILIPVGVVVLAAIIVGVLWFTDVLSFGQGGRNTSTDLASERTSSRDRDRDDEDEDDRDRDRDREGDEDDRDNNGGRTQSSGSQPLQTPAGDAILPSGSGSAPATASASAAAELPQQNTSTPGTGTDLRGNGSLRINGETAVSFTPDHSAVWEIRTTDCGDSDPYLRLYESHTAFLADDYFAYNDDGGEGHNALIMEYLEAGTTYVIGAVFYGGGTGSYTLTTTSIEPIPGRGGDFFIDGHSLFTFTPNQTGNWEFRTFDNGNSDPYLNLYDVSRNRIAYDDDSAGNYNAIISAVLTEGTVYVIEVNFYSDGQCALNVTMSEEVDVLRNGSPVNGNGGVFTVGAPSEFPFTPSRSGIWVIYTTDNGSCDPYLELYDSRGDMITYNDDGGDGRNALLTAFMEAGVTYRINAICYAGATGMYVLNVVYPQELPAGNSNTRVDGATVFSFTPNHSGVWEIETSDCGSSDPYLVLYDENGNEIAYNDDGGEGYNSFLSVTLTAGESYGIYAGFYGSGTGSYTLTVTGR